MKQLRRIFEDADPKDPIPLTVRDLIGLSWCLLFSLIGGIGALLVIMVILRFFSLI